MPVPGLLWGHRAPIAASTLCYRRNAKGTELKSASPATAKDDCPGAAMESKQDTSGSPSHRKRDLNAPAKTNKPRWQTRQIEWVGRHTPCTRRCQSSIFASNHLHVTLSGFDDNCYIPYTIRQVKTIPCDRCRCTIWYGAASQLLVIATRNLRKKTCAPRSVDAILCRPYVRRASLPLR